MTTDPLINQQIRDQTEVSDAPVRPQTGQTVNVNSNVELNDKCNINPSVTPIDPLEIDIENISGRNFENIVQDEINFRPAPPLLQLNAKGSALKNNLVQKPKRSVKFNDVVEFSNM